MSGLGDLDGNELISALASIGHDECFFSEFSLGSIEKNAEKLIHSLFIE